MPAEHVVDPRRRSDGTSPARILQAVLGEIFTGRIAVVCSFGAGQAETGAYAARRGPETQGRRPGFFGSVILRWVRISSGGVRWQQS